VIPTLSSPIHGYSLSFIRPIFQPSSPSHSSPTLEASSGAVRLLHIRAPAHVQCKSNEVQQRCGEGDMSTTSSAPCSRPLRVTEPPKIILYYRLSLSTWPLSNNKELLSRFRRVKPGKSHTTESLTCAKPTRRRDQSTTLHYIKGSQVITN
jgi:hypothetical protein